MNRLITRNPSIDGDNGGGRRVGGMSSAPRTPKERASPKELVDALGSKAGKTTSDVRGVLASQATSATLSWKRRGTSGPINEDGGAIDTGFGRYNQDVYEGQSLLPGEVIDYINVDFRDGTGPAAVAPNEVARAFRDAEILTQAGRSGRHFWSALTNEDDSGNRGLSKFLPGARGLEWRGPGHGDAKRGNRRRKRVVHVESATTGTFFKVYEELDGTGRAGGRGLHNSGGRGGDEHLREGVGGEQGDARGRGDGNPAEDEVQAAERMGVTVRELSLLRFNNGLEASVILVKGVLAGMTLASLYTLVMASDLEDFVAAYEAQSSEFRRAMFFLCTVALMGTEDQLFKEKSKRIDLRGSVCIYGGCLVSTLVCAVADTAIASTIGLTSQTWYMEALADDDFRRKVVLWCGFSVARFLLAWAGWILVCHKGWSASLQSDHSRMELKVQRAKLAGAEKEISRLNGRHLDNLNTRDLHELAGTLKRGLEQVDRIMDLRYRGETTAAVVN